MVKSGKHRVSKPVKLTAPITGVGKLICIGMNYVEHCTEQGMVRRRPRTCVIWVQLG